MHEPQIVVDEANAKVVPRNRNSQLMKAYSSVVGPQTNLKTAPEQVVEQSQSESQALLKEFDS